MTRIIFIFLLVFSLPVFVSAHQEHIGGLKDEISAKTQELKEIHRQIEETQDKLVETERQQTSLSREINRNNYTISQLSLTLKSHLINIDKLGLEINELNDHINESERRIELKSQAIRDILRELQIKDGEPLVAIILKNQSLAESLSEINNLTELRNTLSGDIKRLQELKSELNEQRQLASGKKKEVEKEYGTSRVRKSLIEEKREEQRQLLALAKNQEKSYEQKLQELAERQEEIAREIEAIEAELRRQINTDLLPEPRPGLLAKPVASGTLTQDYGSTKFARYNYRGGHHNGLDYGAPLGTPILAASSGLVLNMGDTDRYCPQGAYGKFIVIKHPNNLTTMYAHLSRFAVEPGDQVERGEVIGYMGSTGFSTGSHLHFTLYDGNTYSLKQSRVCGLIPTGGDLDPSIYL